MISSKKEKNVMKKGFLIFLLSLFVLSDYCQIYADELFTDDNKPKIKVTGDGSIMFGQLVSGYAFGKYGSHGLKKHWLNHYSGRINAISEPTDWFKTVISLEILSAWPILRETTIMKDIFKIQFRANLPQAVGIFDFDLNAVSLMVEAGIMEYAFNEEVKNLGNYMYRSYAYPLNLTTNLDYIYSNLMGIRTKVGLLEDNLNFEVIFNSNTYRAPYFDMNLGFFASFTSPNKFIDAGLGICFDRLIAINDTLTDAINQRTILGDSTLSFRATKLDARVTFDPKVLFPDISVFGPNDLKFYAEAAILGFEDPDYFPKDTANPSIYDSLYPEPSIFHRIPILLGINIPTFKLLDLLSVEFEYCKYPYPFDWWGVTGSFPSPKPSAPTDSTWVNNYKNKDNLKWTAYAKKSISNFDIIAIFSNDHVLYSTHSAESQFNQEQSLRKKGDWQWHVKLQYRL